MLSNQTLLRIKKLLKWTRIAAKFIAIGAAITGAVTALSSSITTGAAISAAGATGFAAAKTVPGKNYDKIRHVSPRMGSSLMPPRMAALPVIKTEQHITRAPSSASQNNRRYS